MARPSGGGAYYNEIDPFAAQWLRNLIAEGLIADGEVDERSIEDVQPGDLQGFDQCPFFAGIGVWSYALRLAGWPDDRPVWTGSCPCQPFSTAGKRGGTADERHLWPAFFHLIDALRPPLVLGEQVASKDGLAWLDLVSADLEGAGYAFGAADLCAAGVGAPHIRQRLWFVGVEHGAGYGRLEGRAEPVGRGAAGRRGDGGLDHHHHQGSQGHAGHDGAEVGRQGPQRPTAAPSLSGGLASADDDRQQSGRLPIRQGRPDEAEAIQQRSGENVRLEQSGSSRREWRQEAASRDEHDRQASLGPQGEHGAGEPGAHRLPEHAGRPGAVNGFWRDADWLLCRDGRWRPVEAGTFPLAHGVAARVGKLRAAGNAIVAQAAQEFIEAVDWALAGDLT